MGQFLVQKWVKKWPKNGSIFGPFLEKPKNFRQRKSAFFNSFFRSIFGQKPQVATCGKYGKITKFDTKKVTKNDKIARRHMIKSQFSQNGHFWTPRGYPKMTHFWPHFWPTSEPFLEPLNMTLQREKGSKMTKKGSKKWPIFCHFLAKNGSFLDTPKCQIWCFDAKMSTFGGSADLGTPEMTHFWTTFWTLFSCFTQIWP